MRAWIRISRANASTTRRRPLADRKASASNRFGIGAVIGEAHDYAANSNAANFARVKNLFPIN
jgi:hypothetical protein